MQSIDSLRARLSALGLDGFIVPCTDPHFSEWLMPSARRLSRLTGFKGSAGTAVVIPDRLLFLTDGRYTNIAAAEIAARPLEVVNIRDRTLEDTLEGKLGTGFRLGYDPWLHTVADLEKLRAVAGRAGFQLIATPSNPVDDVCGTPASPVHLARLHPDQFTGRSNVEKRQEVARSLAAAGADRVLLSAPESICWLLNVRGNDAVDTPLVFAFAIAHTDATVDLFIDPGKVGPDLRAALDEGVRFRPYESLADALVTPGIGRLLALDPSSTCQAVVSLASEAGWQILPVVDPCSLPKAIKTDAEIAGARACHRREGALLCTFWCWLEHESSHRPVRESEIREKIDTLRATDPLFRSPSFETIPATGPNAALPHYHVTEGTDRCLREGEFLLLDSGGQYLDGTTDVTRTFAFGDPSQEMRERYTLVLKSFIRAVAARFPPLTRGIQIDAIARELFWRDGVDFDHSLGHGVGSFLGVHEGPNRLRPNLTGLEPLRSRMITSIEPAFYAKDRFGVRIENLALISETEARVGDESKMLGFEQLTLCPIDLRPIVLDRLTGRERDWLNDYHARVRSELSPLLSSHKLKWLEGRTLPIA